MLSTVTRSFIAATTFSLLSLGGLGISDRANAFGLNLTPFTVGGDATINSANQATILSGSVLTLETGGGSGSLEEFLGIPGGSFDTLFPNNTFGSAIKNTFAVTPGEQITITFNFDFTQDTVTSPSGLDVAFVTVDNDVFSLASATTIGGTYTTNFTAVANSFTLGIGVLDIDDSTGTSTLVVNVPFEFEASGGLLMFGGFFLGKRYLRKSKDKK